MKKENASELIIVAFLAISIISVYWQVKDFKFVSFDDYMYVRDNTHIIRGITSENIRWAFTWVYAANWHPLTWLSHMTDVTLYGLKPGMHHITNVFFHIANTLLLFYLFRRMTGEVWKSAVVATLFALHPLHVESVAWISERKDVLSTFFMMLTILCYVSYTERRTAARYLLVVTCYSLGLMAKPMLVTVPFVFLLLDFWPLKREEFMRTEGQGGPIGGSTWGTGIRWAGVLPLVLEKIPLFLLAGAASALTVFAQKSSGAMSTLEMIPMHIRVENAILSYAAYLGKMVWPSHLAVFYPYSKIFPIPVVIATALLLILITSLAVLLVRRYPFLIVGWLWYLGTLVPVIGIVQVGLQSMADRYTYVPLIGIFIMVAWGLPQVFGQRNTGKYILAGVTCTLMPLLMWSTWLQAGYWKDNITLFSHALEVTRNNYVAHNSLGIALFDRGEIDAAMSHYHEALRINPNHKLAQNNLGAALAKQDRYEEAVLHYEEALRIDPSYAGAHYNLGATLSAMGRTDEAIKEYYTTVQLEPEHVNAHNNLGFALVGQGKSEEALIHYREALRISPDYVRARLNLVSILAKQKRFPDAISMVKEGLQQDPRNPTLLFQLARLHDLNGEKEKAIEGYEKVLSIQPGSVLALKSLAILYAGEKRYDLALSTLFQAARLNPNTPDVYYNIACVYSRQGRIDEAVRSLSDAIMKGLDAPELLKSDPDLENIRGTQFYKNLTMSGRQ